MAPDEHWTIQLVFGMAALAVVALEGALVAHRPVSGTIDRWLQVIVPGSHASFFVAATWFRYPWVVVIGAAVLAALTFRRDRIRAFCCLLGPPLAIVLAEEVVKPLVGRTLGGTFTYPSGSTTGAAALATAAILAAPPRWKRVTAILAVAYALWMMVSVVALQWHFPTDSIGGSLLGAGVVLTMDAAAHLVGGRLPTRGRQALAPRS